jgi:hypothetical protein
MIRGLAGQGFGLPVDPDNAPLAVKTKKSSRGGW